MKHYSDCIREAYVRESGSTLEKFVEENAGIHQDAVLAYLPDGRRLTNDNLRDLAGVPDNVCVTVYLGKNTHRRVWLYLRRYSCSTSTTWTTIFTKS